MAEQDIVLVHATKLDYFKLFLIWSAYLGNQSRLFRHFLLFDLFIYGLGAMGDHRLAVSF